MQQIRTNINGISTQSSYQDGTAYSLVNLRPKNGALHPVPPRKVVQELSQKYHIVYVHQNNDYKNWIGVVNSGDYSSVYWDVRDEQPQSIASYIQGTINSVQQIGNTLSLITEDNIYYLFYQNNKYTFLGELPNLPPIQLDTSNEAHIKTYFVNEYGSGTIKPDNFIDSTKGLVNKAIDKLVNGWTDPDGTIHEGFGLRLFDAHYIRYAFRLFDGTLVKHSAPILVMPMRNILELKTIDYDFDSALRNESCVDVYGYRIAMNYNFAFDNWRDWIDIIKSVDIFLSAPLGISNIENIRQDMPTSDSPHTLHFYLIKEITPESFKNVENSSTFYFIRSIDLGTVKEGLGNDRDTIPSSESDISKIENLIYQEVMSDDNFSNHKYGAAISYTYNNRLHLGDIKTTFFGGYDPRFFLWFGTADGGSGSYNGYSYEKAPGEKWGQIIIETEIATGLSTEKVYNSFSYYAGWPIYKLFMSAFISYPDVRAQRMTIYLFYDENYHKVKTLPLTAHNYLNLAHYIQDGLNPVVSDIDPVAVERPNTNTTIVFQEPNKIKVSELNNPMRFPNVNTYLVGNGTILAMATNAIRISEGQFGQYPLYIFTTQGIYSLDVGQGEVVYSNKSAPTSYEIPTTSIVTSTPFGVVFTSARGICIIRGQEVELLTPQLQEAPRILQVQFVPAMEGIVHNFEQMPFGKYLDNLDNLVYDPYENELIICDKESNFNYVLNFYSQSFYQSTERIDLIVGNTFPELNVVSENKLKDYSAIDIDKDGNARRTDISFILRPVQFGSHYIKWLSESLMFTNLYDTDKLRWTVHSSNDGINFKLVSGVGPMDRKRYTKLDHGRIPGNKFSHFLFTFGATVGHESWIECIESIVGEEYRNRLTR